MSSRQDEYARGIGLLGPRAWQGFLEAAPDAMVIVDPQGCIVMVNRLTERMFGFSRDQLFGKPIAMLVPDGHRGEQGRRRDGSEFPVEIHRSPLETEKGTLMANAIRDVTDRRKADEKFRGLLEAAPDGMVFIDRDGRIVLVNSQTERLFGYSRAELLGRPVEMLVPERLREQHSGHRLGYFASPKTRSMGSGLELYGRRRDGTEFPVEISLSPLHTDEGILISAAIRDVSERKRADEARFRLAALVDSSDDAIIGMALDGRITSWNKGAERIFGHAAEEARGKPISLLFPSGRPDEELELLERLRRGERVDTFETLRRRKDGQNIHVSVTVSPIYDPTGRLIGASKVARDITDRKLAEAALARAKEIAEDANRELEAFSYSVAHDLRAPLRGIDGFSQALLEDHADKLDAEGQGYLHRVRRSAQQMAQLIEDLLMLARVTRSKLRQERVDLSLLARATAERLRTAQPERKVELLVADGLIAQGDSHLLAIVLDNLLGNAWKFTARRPLARIEIGETREGGRPVYFVRDNGAGFDMAYASKLFGVFQRLHSAGEFEGTGIGLATVQRIIRRHGGRIWAESEVDRGAIFHFTLATDGKGRA